MKINFTLKNDHKRVFFLQIVCLIGAAFVFNIIQIFFINQANQSINLGFSKAITEVELACKITCRSFKLVICLNTLYFLCGFGLYKV